MSSALSGFDMSSWRRCNSWCSAPSLPLPAIVSSSTERPRMSSTSCLNQPILSRFGTETSPSSGDSSPAIRRNNVDLPEPLGPTRPTFSPAFSCMDASTKSAWWPWRLLMPFNAIMGAKRIGALPRMTSRPGDGYQRPLRSCCRIARSSASPGSRARSFSAQGMAAAGPWLSRVQASRACSTSRSSGNRLRASVR